jgi:glycosyltransferase involved in cell wall biosynthesis
MTDPKVTVVICTYNQQAFVRETLDSVLGQTYRNVEIVVTDDGSTDDTPSILSEYAQQFPGHVQIVLSDRNTGIPANINRGLARRTGDLLVVLDGDDLMLPDKLAKQVAFLQEHPDALGCYHDAEVFESETGRTLGRMSEVYNGMSRLRQGRLKDWLAPRNFFLPSAIMSRSEACPAHGFDERLKYLSEVVFYAETYRNGLLLAMPEPLVRYRRHARNVTDDAVARSLMTEYELVAYAILEARYPELHVVLKRLRLSCLLTAGLRSYRDGQPERGRQYMVNVMAQGGLLQGAIAGWARPCSTGGWQA